MLILNALFVSCVVRNRSYTLAVILYTLQSVVSGGIQEQVEIYKSKWRYTRSKLRYTRASGGTQEQVEIYKKQVEVYKSKWRYTRASGDIQEAS